MENNVESFLLNAIEGMRSDVQKMSSTVTEMSVQIKALAQVQTDMAALRADTQKMSERLTVVEQVASTADKWQERSTANLRSMLTIGISVIIVLLGVTTFILAHWK